MKQVPVFAVLVCTKYLACYHIIFRYSVSLIPEACLFRKVVLCQKYILFEELGLFCFDGNRGIYSHHLREVWMAS